jgi:ferredoxin
MDFTVSKIIGYDPYEIEIIKAGIKRKNLINPEKIKIKGDYSEAPGIFFKKPEFGMEHTKEKDFLYQAVLVRPEINNKKCSNCGSCIEDCKLYAIHKKDYPVIDRSKCLNCYYCFYNCPEKAISLKGNYLNYVSKVARKLLGL